MAAAPMEHLLEDESPPVVPDWERFYRSFRHPGYIPGYEIVNKLGGGVFGIVFKARKQSIQKDYAIKFLKIDDHAVREPVRSELETVTIFARVDHPNLVSIEDQGLVDGIPYIIMGFAGEETLADRLLESRPPEEEVLRLFVQSARGVQALHDHSLSHFDLKPGNIFLKGDIARVGDYGLSKLVTGSCMSLTFGRGTPYYMAPEMLHRRGDHRSDIYSLGVILYECLSGKVPFEGENEWEVLKAHEEETLVLPDSMPSRYRILLKGMLAKRPEDRYGSIQEILEDLKAGGCLGESLVLEYGSGSFLSRSAPPVRPPPPGHANGEILRVPLPPSDPEWRVERRRGGGIALALLALLGFLVGMGVLLFGLRASNRLDAGMGPIIRIRTSQVRPGIRVQERIPSPEPPRIHMNR